MVPDHGRIEIRGLDSIRDYRRIRLFTGYMAGRFSLYQDLTVKENLSFYATLFGTTVEKNYSVIQSVYRFIEPFKDRLAGKLSGGMKQKLALSCALIHKPEILVLDEPTTGVDAVSRKEFWELLKELQAKGMTILVSTPYMDEAMLCDRVALLQNGVIMHCDTPRNILAGYDRKLFAVRSSDLHRLINDLRSLDEIASACLFGQDVHITLKETALPVMPEILVSKLMSRGHKDIKMVPISPGIEDVFIESAHSHFQHNNS
jgi:ABC-type multidrug transport system ATPase subunit